MTAALPGQGGQPHNRAAITVCVMLATIMQALDTTIANVALPHMQGSLSASQDQINWVLTSYIVAAAIMTPPTGWIAARFGRRRFFLASIAGFTLASILCGLALNLTQIVLYRLLQGVFGAALVPLSQAILLDIYPRERQGSAMAIWGIGIMVGPILGPSLGAWLTETYSWRWVFYINVPVGILAVIGIATFLPETSRQDDARLDWFGFGTLSVGIGALQLMLDRGEQLDWFGSREIITEAIVAGLGLYLFVVHTLTAEKSFVSRRLFADRNFTAALFLAFAVGIILMSTLALMTPFLQSLLGYPILTAGLLMGPRGVGTMLAMMVVGRIVGRTDPRYLIALGLTLTAISLWQMSGFTTEVDEKSIFVTGFIQGLGLGFVFVPLSAMAFATLPPDLRTQGAGLFTLLRNIGGSIGIAIVTSQLVQMTQVNHAQIGEHISPFNTALRAPALQRLFDPFTAAGQVTLNAEVTRQATMIAFIDCFSMLMIVAVVTMPLLLIMRNPNRRTA